MRVIPLATVAAALLMAVPASAQGNSQAATTAATSAAPGAKAAKEEKKVCKRLETSGTRMAERVCLTKEEWKKVDEQRDD